MSIKQKDLRILNSNVLQILTFWPQMYISHVYVCVFTKVYGFVFLSLTYGSKLLYTIIRHTQIKYRVITKRNKYHLHEVFQFRKI